MKYILSRILILQILLLLVLLSAMLPAQDGEEETTVVAKGIGAIIGGDEAKAADDALANALRNAVEQVVGTMVESNVLVSNYQVMEDRIYTRTTGYVKSYQTINSSKSGTTLFEVTIKAVVKKSNLQNDLDAIGLLISRKNKPRLMVLVDEKNMHQHYYYYHWDLNTTSTELANKFLEKGFTFVDRDIVAKNLNRDAVIAAIEGNGGIAPSIVQDTGAEVLIIGKAISKAASGGPSVLRNSGMISCQATLNLRAIRADNGDIIAATSQQAAAVHIDEVTGGTQALKKAAGLASQELISQILKTWQRDVYSGASIQIRVLNIPSFGDLVKFKNMLKMNIRGVQNVIQRDFSSNTAVLEAETKANAQQFAEELAIKDFTPYQVEVVDFSQNHIVVKLGIKKPVNNIDQEDQ